MCNFYFGDKKDINISSWDVAIKVKRYRFPDIFVKLVNCVAMGENILAYATSTPGFAIVVDLNLDKHVVILPLRRE